MMTGNSGIQLGLGLIGIGRDWGFKKSPVPEEQSVSEFLAFAFKLGITLFDTAASYGFSEERLGDFLRTLNDEKRARITVATKFGDHWDHASQTAHIDHSYEALRKSLDRSLFYLGQIDMLLLHRPSPETFGSADVKRAFGYARGKGISAFGASVKDQESGKIVCGDDTYSAIQLPYNAEDRNLEAILDYAAEQDKFVMINRPFNMGALLYSGDSSPETVRTNAYRAILKKKFRGVILTGTTSQHHLQENWTCFNEAMQEG